MWAGSDVCGLFVENVGLFAENVGLKYRPFAQNVSRTKGIFVGPRDYVCGPLHLSPCAQPPWFLPDPQSGKGGLKHGKKTLTAPLRACVGRGRAPTTALRPSPFSPALHSLLHRATLVGWPYRRDDWDVEHHGNVLRNGLGLQCCVIQFEMTIGVEEIAIRVQTILLIIGDELALRVLEIAL